ncbi:unnamed protein product [Parascedosporium putredinis]|uniref:Uncharacterized protein n=1 Tax=Parascedosporium putredinis TaxID=1442378 RepID=A0A9P1H297_9PEZI|nr:unnamed protein product [Parascedosporium putredinis]CAI7994720.1 unnamed protein product [Parascedosporium putredinis]
MQLSIFALAAFAAVALANPSTLPGPRSWVVLLESLGPIRARQQPPSNPNAITTGPAVNQPAMTDRNGNVISFDSAKVYLAAKEAGL